MQFMRNLILQMWTRESVPPWNLFLLLSADLWYAVVDEDGRDGDVAADPVSHVSPVCPKSVCIILDATSLDTKPKYFLIFTNDFF